MVEEAVAVEDDLRDALASMRLRGDQLPTTLAAATLPPSSRAAVLELGRQARGRDQRLPGEVVDHLRVDVARSLRKTASRGRSPIPCTFAHRTRSCRRTLAAASLRSGSWHSSRPPCLLGAGLAGLPDDDLVGVLDALALVRLRRREPRISAATWPTSSLSTPRHRDLGRLLDFTVIPSGAGRRSGASSPGRGRGSSPSSRRGSRTPLISRSSSTPPRPPGPCWRPGSG